MFRKLVSNLSFSPALIHEVGFYASRLRKEEATRRLSVFFMVLALIVQSLAVFSPPESANASSEQDLIRGGVVSKDDFLARYDANEANIKDIYTTAGITRAEIDQAGPATVNSKDNLFVMNRFAEFGASQGEVAFTYRQSLTLETGTTYMSPLRLRDTSDASKHSGTAYTAWVGQSKTAGWFAILKDCANLATKTLPTGTSSVVSATMDQQLSAINLSQNNAPADSTSAHAGDRISFTISAKNTGSKSQPTPLLVPLGDVLEYAHLTDNGGGLFDVDSKVLSWAPVSLAAQATEKRTFVIQLVDPIPATPVGQSNQTSYDCTLTSAFGTTLNIRVDCPAAKVIESTTSQLPTLGIIGNLIFSNVVAVVVTYFYLRTRQLKKEIRLIRHNLNTGIL